MKQLALHSNSSGQTHVIAQQIGRRLRGGETIELVSDLGGGKTTFTQGLVAGLDSDDKVVSPTFTISKVYAAGRLRVYHFDFYRLHEPGLIAEDLAEVLHDSEAVVVVEWADIVAGILPEKRLRIQIRTVGETERILNCTYDQSLAYLLEGLG